MTHPHPLTDELAESIDPLPIKRLTTGYASMRAAADWQLEQVIEWLKKTKHNQYLYLWEHGAEMEKDELIADLKKAMRPKPKSPAEEALGLLNEGPVSDLLDHEIDSIRSALERLREHEQQVEAHVND